MKPQGGLKAIQTKYCEMGRRQTYRINSSTDGQHPALKQGVKEDMVQPTRRKSLMGPICSKIELELMPPNGEWESLRQRKGWKFRVGSGELGSSPLGSLWKKVLFVGASPTLCLREHLLTFLVLMLSEEDGRMEIKHHQVQMMRDKTRDQFLQMLLSVLLTAQDQPGTFRIAITLPVPAIASHINSNQMILEAEEPGKEMVMSCCVGEAADRKGSRGPITLCTATRGLGTLLSHQLCTHWNPVVLLPEVPPNPQGQESMLDGMQSACNPCAQPAPLLCSESLRNPSERSASGDLGNSLA
ncbi:hypothetical protein EK904_000328 [Melospiza melodia maxima]|nr:hypothetical protein EK904_000328 [Melospiza melodia maxima]